MRILLDEDLPRRLASLLAGHEVPAILKSLNHIKPRSLRRISP